MVLPLGFSILLVVIGAIFRKRWLALAGAAILLLSGMPAVGDSLLKILENRFPKLEADSVERADAVIVLSGMLRESRSKRGDPEWGEGVDRFEAGVQLMKAGKAPLLILTGGRMPWSNRTQTEGDELRAAAIARGIAENAIVVTGEVHNTAEEAEAIHQIAMERKLQRLILVTTAWHMPRAEMLFRRAGVDVVPYPVDYYTRYMESRTMLDLVPQASGMLNTEIALREFYGLAYYRVIKRK